MGFTMKLRVGFRRLKAHETDAELTFGVLFFPLCGLALLGLSRLLRALVPICLFRRVTGIPCGTCGTFRAYEALLSGRMGESFRLQPFMTVLAWMAMAYSVYAWIVVLGRRPRLRIDGMSADLKKTIALVFVGLFLANWVYLIACAR